MSNSTLYECNIHDINQACSTCELASDVEVLPLINFHNSNHGQECHFDITCGDSKLPLHVCNMKVGKIGAALCRVINHAMVEIV